jgi:hypothetical protein
VNLGKKRGYLWVTLSFFVLTLVGHWTFAWFSYAQEQREHDRPAEVAGYVIETSRDTLENWQSEFLQLIWQVAGLSLLLYVGSPQSKEGSERIEGKIDALVRRLCPEDAPLILEELEKEYPKN